MERFIDNLIRDFDSGKIDRRGFCEGVAIAAAVVAAGPGANAAETRRGFTMLGFNHLSYQCPDYRIARDFYSNVFGMQVLNDNGRSRANAAFGPEPDKGGNFLVVHNPGNNPPKPTTAIVDHVCFSIGNWNEAAIKSELAAKKVEVRGNGGSLRLYDPFDFDIQFGNAESENVYNP